MIKVTDIAYVRFRAPDLDEMEKFLLEFGLHRAERRAGVTPTEKAVDDARMACIFLGRLRGVRWSLAGGTSSF